VISDRVSVQLQRAERLVLLYAFSDRLRALLAYAIARDVEEEQAGVVFQRIADRDRATLTQAVPREVEADKR